jgi:hypothetical protein
VAKILELILACERRERVRDLIVAAGDFRPDLRPNLSPVDLDPVQETVRVAWGFDEPGLTAMLEGAERSMLCLGTSHYRMMTADVFRCREWLDAEPHRILGILFLNPHSPHAFQRKRRDVWRSSREKIVEALRRATEEARRHPRFFPVVYDGPYRYSAKADDIGLGKESTRSCVSLVSSSHRRGISAGFRVALRPDEHPESFAYYRRELLHLWKSALVNPAGHGISVILDWSPDSDQTERIASQVRALLAGLTGVETEYTLFSAAQLHLTLTSLCRTQRQVAAPPLSIDSADEAGQLPAHFPEFVVRVARAMDETLPDELRFDLDRLFLDEEGYIVLGAGQEGDAAEAVNGLLRSCNTIVDQLEEAFPGERWGQRLGGGQGYRFRPKHTRLPPHITLGRAFDGRNGLPVPLRGETATLPIPPIHLEARQAVIVHYAYRSMLRCVGRIPLALGHPVSLCEMDAVRHLRI